MKLRLVTIVLLGSLALGSSAARLSALDGLRLSWPGLHFDTFDDALQFNPFFSILRKALRSAGLDEVLNDRDLVATVVAPTDQAFETLLKDLDMSEQELLDDDKLLRKVLKYHVIPDKALKSDDLRDGQVVHTLLRGQDLEVSKESYFFVNKITLRGCNPKSRTAMVIIPDVEAARLVIHVIDEVLLPDLSDDRGDEDEDEDEDEEEE